jgi:hypothetical protein
MVALATTAPEGSTTWPVINPRNSWALRVSGNSKVATITALEILEIEICLVLLMDVSLAIEANTPFGFADTSSNSLSRLQPKCLVHCHNGPTSKASTVKNLEIIQ